MSNSDPILNMPQEPHSREEDEEFMNKFFYSKEQPNSSTDLEYWINYPYTENEIKEINEFSDNLTYHFGCGSTYGELYLDQGVLSLFCKKYPFFTPPLFLVGVQYGKCKDFMNMFYKTYYNDLPDNAVDDEQFSMNTSRTDLLINMICDWFEVTKDKQNEPNYRDLLYRFLDICCPSEKLATFIKLELQMKEDSKESKIYSKLIQEVINTFKSNNESTSLLIKSLLEYTHEFRSTIHIENLHKDLTLDLLENLSDKVKLDGICQYYTRCYYNTCKENYQVWKWLKCEYNDENHEVFRKSYYKRTEFVL